MTNKTNENNNEGFFLQLEPSKPLSESAILYETKDGGTVLRTPGKITETLKLSKHPETGEAILKVKGVGIRNNISRNRRRYDYQNLDDKWGTLEGRPIGFDHSTLAEDNIGRVTKTYIEQSKDYRDYMFEGWIMDTHDRPDVIKRTRTGLLSEMSMENSVKKVSEGKDGLLNIEIEEVNTITPVQSPGFLGTSMMAAESMGSQVKNSFTEALGNMNENMKTAYNHFKNTNGGLNDMTTNNEKTEEKVSNEAITSQTLKPNNTENSDETPKNNDGDGEQPAEEEEKPEETQPEGETKSEKADETLNIKEEINKVAKSIESLKEEFIGKASKEAKAKVNKEKDKSKLIAEALENPKYEEHIKSGKDPLDFLKGYKLT